MSEVATPTRDNPDRIGRYELCAEIASGGMGRVYLGRVRGPGGFEKLVAVKTVHPDLIEEEHFVDMFLDEARIAARIDHPNVCHVFDFGQVDGRYFIAMEYLVGEPIQRVLRKLARRDRVPEDDRMAARLIADAAEGLHAAHELVDEHGEPLHVVHRDVSPQNVFVTYDGGVRIVDFGVARARGKLHQTDAGSLKGKISYMAPEAMRGTNVDRRADVWGLGVILWELLVGRRLMRGASEVDIILAVTREPPPRPSTMRTDVNPELEAIVMQALTVDVDQRFATARDMGQALEQWIASRGEPVGLPQVADYMSRHFVEERMAAFERIDSVRQSSSRIRPTQSSQQGRRQQDGADPPARADVAAATPTAPAPASSSTRRMLGAALGGGLFVSALVGGFALVSWSNPSEAPASNAISQTAPAELSPTTAQAHLTEDIETDEPAAPTAVEAALEAPEADEPALAPEADSEDAPAVEDAPAEAAPVEAAPRPEREARTPRATVGQLIVRTPGGWADVYVDGSRVGRTPLELELPAGRVRVELRPYGLPPPASASSMRRRVQIGARPQTIQVAL